MNEAQLLAGVICAVLVVLVGAASIRWRLPSVTAIFMLMFAIPALGFATYARAGGPQPDLATALLLAGILYGVGLVVAGYSIVFRIRHRKPTVWKMATDNRRYLVGLLTRWVIVIWISSFLFLFEPAFAVANIALNLLWMVIWMPRRMRTFTQRTETEIDAPTERVFEFVRDVRNWPLYRDDVELVSVTPDAPLSPGSVYVARMAIPESLRRTSYRHFESRYRVTAMQPGRSYAIRLLDQSSVAQTLFEPTTSGTRVLRTAETTLGLLRAWSADMLNHPRADEAVRTRNLQTSRRLKEILEAGNQ